MKQLENVGHKIAEWIAQEMDDQKHTLTGAIKDIDIEVEQVSDGWVLRGKMQHYAEYLDQGVPADRIPFSGSTGRGGTSKYIEGLINFAELRGFNNPKSAAFAIAYTQMREGMPTFGSRRLADRRTGFMDYVFNIHQAEIKEEIQDAFDDYISVDLVNIFKRNGAEVTA